MGPIERMSGSVCPACRVLKQESSECPENQHGKFTAKPGTQFTIRKEIYSRVQKAFEENGIEFARREVRVKIPEREETASLSEAEKTTIATAAAEAVQAS